MVSQQVGPQQAISTSTSHQTSTSTKQHTSSSSVQRATMDQLVAGQELAAVRELGRRASFEDLLQVKAVAEEEEAEEFEGNSRVTSLSTIAAMSGHSRLVVALAKEGAGARLKIQDMRPGFFEVGASGRECRRYLEEHERLIERLSPQKPALIESWLDKYRHIKESHEPRAMSAERRLVYLCMLESLEACWRSLMRHLERRSQLLNQTQLFYASCERLSEALQQSESHVQAFRAHFLAGGFEEDEEPRQQLVQLNARVEALYLEARRLQVALIKFIEELSASNLGDARPSHSSQDSRALLEHIRRHLEPLIRRRVQLESTLLTVTRTEATRESSATSGAAAANNNNNEPGSPPPSDSLAPQQQQQTAALAAAAPAAGKLRLREISSFGDLDLMRAWLRAKADQLNSSLLSSLGVSAPDSRSLLAKHEQIALECRALHEATCSGGARQQVAPPEVVEQDQSLLTEQRLLLAEQVRHLSGLVEARIALLRRTIDFYQRAVEADADINRMLERLQLDDSLPSVQLVQGELELKDVSSVIASGGTIVSELQQLQLAAQQHDQQQQQRLVNLDLATTGIRRVVDQLSQELASLKTQLAQRKLKLLNEDSGKTAQNFAAKCGQLQAWLGSQARNHLLNSSRVPRDQAGARLFCESTEQLRADLQSRTLEIEALLRSLGSLTKNLEQRGRGPAEGPSADELQRAVDRLRHEWIETSTCLERRLDLVKRYLGVHAAARSLDQELDALETLYEQPSSTDPPGERSQDDIRSSVDQSSLQLVNKVRNFESEARSLKTELVCSQNGLRRLNDLNKDELIAEANNLLKAMRLRRDSINQRESRRSSAADSQARNQLPAHRRPQQLDPPRFTRPLQDQLVEPFSTVELECHTDDAQCQVEWLMNNMRRIPSSIKHSESSEGNQHRLTIRNFSSLACATFVARASNAAGQTCCQCRLRLKGIKESADEPTSSSLSNSRQQSVFQHESASHSRAPTSGPNEPRATPVQSGAPEVAPLSKSIERVIRGVEQPESPVNQPLRITQLATSDSETETNADHPTPSLTNASITQSTYAGPTTNKHQSNNNNNNNNNNNYNYTTTSTHTNTTTTNTNRSVSKSPYEGTPQPPVFLQGLSDSMPRSCSRAGLVCLVVGNPPPTIEWLHNDQMIATAKCARPNNSPRSNLCKLTIETINPHTQGHYVCRASNPIGQTTTSLTLTK